MMLNSRDLKAIMDDFENFLDDYEDFFDTYDFSISDKIFLYHSLNSNILYNDTVMKTVEELRYLATGSDVSGPMGLEALVMSLCGGPPSKYSSVSSALSSIADALSEIAQTNREKDI